MPRYEFVENTSRKFWEIGLSGNSFTVRFGRIGGEGRSQTKTFATAAEANAQYGGLIADKVKKGYRLVGEKKAAMPAKKSAAPVRVIFGSPACHQPPPGTPHCQEEGIRGRQRRRRTQALSPATIPAAGPLFAQ